MQEETPKSPKAAAPKPRPQPVSLDLAPPDRFISFWAKLGEKLVPKLGTLLVLVIAGMVVAMVVWGGMQFAEAKREKATALLSRALRVYGADLLPEKDAPPVDEETPRFKTVKERADAALQALDKLDQEYGSSDAATRGLLLRAGIHYDQGRYEQAAAAYRAFVDKKPPSAALLATAREGLGVSVEAQGKLDEALSIYKEATVDFYKDRMAWNQARVYTKKGDKKKAAEIYKEILSKSPQTPLKDDINNRLASLENS